MCVLHNRQNPLESTLNFSCSQGLQLQNAFNVAMLGPMGTNNINMRRMSHSWLLDSRWYEISHSQTLSGYPSCNWRKQMPATIRLHQRDQWDPVLLAIFILIYRVMLFLYCLMRNMFTKFNYISERVCCGYQLHLIFETQCLRRSWGGLGYITSCTLRGNSQRKVRIRSFLWHEVSLLWVCY
jgi:hypothetical protein